MREANKLTQHMRRGHRLNTTNGLACDARRELTPETFDEATAGARAVAVIDPAKMQRYVRMVFRPDVHGPG
jgi:hypothetical protein